MSLIPEKLTLVQPMEPILRAEPFNSPDYLYQIKWDGIRMLTYFDNGTIRFVNRKIRDKTEQFPELSSIKNQLHAASAILDGEIIAFGTAGRPRFSQVMKRNLASVSNKIPFLVKQIPVIYMLFDILYLNDRWMVDLPLTKRQTLLANVVSSTDQIQLCDNYGDGMSLFAQMKRLDMEGIVMKQRAGTYHIGQKHATWYKVKYFRRIHAVVGGATFNQGWVNSLLLGVYQDNQLFFIGGAGSGLNTEQIRLLTQSAQALKHDVSPFQNPPRLPKGTYIWLLPQLTVEIEFMEWTEDMTLRSPVIKAFNRVATEECQFPD